MDSGSANVTQSLEFNLAATMLRGCFLTLGLLLALWIACFLVSRSKGNRLDLIALVAMAWRHFLLSFAKNPIILSLTLVLMISVSLIPTLSGASPQASHQTQNIVMFLKLLLYLPVSVCQFVAFQTIGANLYAGDLETHAQNKIKLYLKFIVVQTITSCLSALGFLFFFVPGVICQSLTFVAAPASIYTNSKPSPINRSFRLCRPDFWNICTVTIPITALVVLPSLTSVALQMAYHNSFASAAMSTVLEITDFILTIMTCSLQSQIYLILTSYHAEAGEQEVESL